MGADDETQDDEFRALFDTSPEGMVLVDAATQSLRYCNAAAVRMFGCAESELLARIMSQLAPEESPHASLAALLRDEQARTRDITFRKAGDGTRVRGDVTITTLTMRARPVVAMFCREAVAASTATVLLAASELRYRRLFESAMDGILILEADSGRVLDANPFLCGLIGSSREELVGHRVWELGPFQNVAAMKSSFVELQTAGYVRHEHLPLQARDGRTIDVEFVSNVYESGGDRVAQCNIRDITERRRNDATLRMLNRAVQAVSQGILITDALQDGNPIAYASPGFERMTGYARAEVVGKNCRFLQGPGSDAATLAILREAISQGRPCTVELLNYRMDRSTFWNQLAITPIRDATGRLTHYVGVQTDVTDRRTLETQYLQAQKMDALGRLAGGVAHDFNNMLSVILSYSDLILSDAPDSLIRPDVEEIKRAALRAAELTSQLLTFSRKRAFATQVLDLHQSVLGMVKMLSRLLGAEHRLTILPAHEVGKVNADPAQIEQVVMNLTINARDAMTRGGEVVVDIRNVELDQEYARLHQNVRPGLHVMLSVSDTGTGMDSATQARIFEPFFTTKAEGKGTGLGLATVFGIVQRCGGHLAVDSKPGVGTTFRIYLEAVGGCAEEVLPAERRPLELAQPHQTILLVEDDDQVRDLAADILRRRGYVVRVAANAGEALLICEQQGPEVDLIVTDVVLPRMSGRQLVGRLMPLCSNMRVLFMSGHPEEKHETHGIEGASAFLQKPFTPASLLERVQQALHSKA